MLLIKMLVMCGDKPPAVISICDCMDHMVNGGKKDAEFVMNFLNQRKMSLIQQKYTMTLFSFTELPMCRKQGKYCVPTFHEQCVFMVGSMYCHWLSVINLGLVLQR